MKLPAASQVVLACLLLGVTTLLYPWTPWDTASSAYLGQTVLEGGAPYGDAWNVKAPGVFFAYALGILLFGKSALGMRLFDLLWQCATALVLARGGKRMFRSTRAGQLSAVAYLFVHYAQHYWGLAQADGFLTLPLAAAFLFLLRALDDDRELDWAAAAFCVGLAAIFKLIFGVVGVALLAAAFARRPASRNLFLRRLLPLAAGVSLPLLAIAVYLRSHGALDEFLFTQFVLAPELTRSLRDTVGWTCIAKSLLRPIFCPLLLLFLATGRTLGRAARADAALRLPVMYCWAWFLIGAFTVVLHGAYYTYQFQPLYGPLALLAGSGLESVVDALRPERGTKTRILALAGLGLFLVVPAGWLSQRLAFSWQVLSGHEPANEWRELGTYLRDHTRQDERIFVWGNVPAIYLYAERKSCSRFIFSYFLSVRWRHVDYRPVFLKELRAAMPRYLVIVKEGPPEPCSGHTIGALEAFEQFAELKQLVESEYVVDRQTSDYAVYARRTERISKARGQDSVPGT